MAKRVVVPAAEDVPRPVHASGQVEVKPADPWGLAVRIVLVAVATGVGLWLAVTLRQVLLQVLVAVILANGLSPLVNWLQRRLGLPRGAAVLLIYLGLILLLVALGVAVVPPVLHEIDQVVRNAPRYGDLATDLLRDLQRQFPFLPPLDEQLLAQARNLGAQIGALTTQALAVARFALGFFSGVLSTLLVLLLTLYLVVDGPRIRDYFLSFFDPARHAQMQAVSERIGLRMGGWLLGQVTLCAVVGVFSFIGLTLIGVPSAVLLALVAGVGELIPIVGPIASMVPAIIVAATVSPVHAGLVLALYILIQQLENNLLVPKIMERAVSLHPLAVVLSLLVGSELLGVIGAIVAVPVAAGISVVLHEVRAMRLAERAASPESLAARGAASAAVASPEPEALADARRGM